MIDEFYKLTVPAFNEAVDVKMRINELLGAGWWPDGWSLENPLPAFPLETILNFKRITIEARPIVDPYLINHSFSANHARR